MKVVITLIVVVLVTATAQAQVPVLKLDKTFFHPGEEIRVHFEAPPDFPRDAWVGIIPSHVAHGDESVNDQHDIAYLYLEERTKGTLTFRAPRQPGAYDLRMHDTDGNGKEVAWAFFSVALPAEEEPATLVIGKDHFKPGEKIEVGFTAPGTFAKNAWVGIIPSEVAHGLERENDNHDLAYVYLGGKTRGTLVFEAPDNPGRYDLRMHDTDNDGREVASVTFTVE